ncbi:hypothetical protein GCG54_00007135 [Colletotrichum gloeosporioides]|uniref:NACHT-NTPase and P-loop NTPases N-terminal domain-containing protein n=1 Tax=Colletotrichum gloeosporioides TaxID=474922 RepID=A0A8H4FLV3_COLGL|nr:uncharacterized protein GCG54_00007135 [Colletotrichum gloeosporioides]KAF3806885.1 hypothetical protein GCG54_00007135 [Colletotrichum gloeosporioides]
MSGVEAVIGLIGGVIGLLEAANKAYATIKDMAGLPKAFQEVSQRIPLVLQILEHVKTNAGQAPRTTIDAITPVVTSCKGEAEMLKDILEGLASEDSKWDLNRYVKMIKCKGKKGRVEDLMKKIIENVQILASDQTMKLATSQQLQELGLAVEGLKIIEPSAPDELLRQGETVTINYDGTGSQHNQIGNNNTSTTWHGHGTGHMIQGNAYFGAAPGSPSHTICYFFFKDDFQDQKSVSGAMCAILHQIFMEKPFLVSDKMLNDFEMIGFKLAQSFQHLWDILISVSYGKSGNITCILDAVDECEEYERTQIVAALCLLFKNPERPKALKFLLTSRMDGQISRGLQSLESLAPTIHLHGEDEEQVDKIAQEINLVIRGRVFELGMKFSLNQAEEELLYDELTSMPNRTYLWVYLTAKEFLQGSHSDDLHPERFIWKASFDPLESNRVLTGVCAKYLHFMGMTNSPFPLHLHVPSNCMCDENWVKYSFLAYSVEYWTLHCRNATVMVDWDIENLIADLCNVDWVGCLPWVTAYNTLLPEGRQIDPSSFTTLILVSYFGLEEMVSKLIQKEHIQLNIKDNKYGRSALAWAARNGHSNVVRVLVNTVTNLSPKEKFRRGKVDVNSVDQKGQTPLSLAAEWGHESVVRHLVESKKADQHTAMKPQSDNF